MSFGVLASAGVEQGSAGGNSPYADAILAKTPLLFLQFDETGGTTLVDSSGNGRDGTYSGAPLLGTYPVAPRGSGHSVCFEGGSGGGLTGDNASISYDTWMNTPAMTLLFPCFMNSSNLSLIVSRYAEPGDEFSWFVCAKNGTFQLWYAPDTAASPNYGYWIDSGVVITQGHRYYVAAYVGASEAGIRIYDDTGLLGQATSAGATLRSSQNSILLMNAESGNYNETGYLDELAIFGSALSTGEIDTLADLALGFGQTPWLERSAGVLPHNGTTTQTMAFTPASAGSLLVAVVATSATQTLASVGWTERLTAVGDTSLAIYTRNANAGDDTLEVTLGVADVPATYVVYEFPPGSAWHSGASAVNSPILPTLSGLPGDGSVAVFCSGSIHLYPSDASVPVNTWWYFWRTDTNQGLLADGAINGIYQMVGYFPQFNGTTADVEDPASQITWQQAVTESITFAISTP